MASRMLSQWLPSMGTTSTFPASAHRPTHTQSRTPASTCHRSCSPRAISAQTRSSESLVGLCSLDLFPNLVLSSNHLSKMACHWKPVCPLTINHYRIRLCLCFISSDFTQGKIIPPYLGKSPLTLLLSLENILVPSLVHPRPKARLCLSIPLSSTYLSANRVFWGWTEL